MKVKTIQFDGEMYQLTEHEDGSKTLLKEKNRAGFKIIIHVSGDPEEHKAGIQAVENFFVKGSSF